MSGEEQRGRAPDFDDVIRAIATLKLELDKIDKRIDNMRSDLKHEVRSVGARIEAIDARIGVLAVETKSYGDRAHRIAGLMVPMLDEAGILHQATVTLQSALELAQRDTQVAITFGRMLETIEDRIGQLRKDVRESRPPPEGGPRSEGGR